MKKICCLLMLFFCVCFIKRAGAQVHIDVSVNIGTQPEWGPTGYDHVEYYYVPDIDVYYCVPKHQFIYLEAGRWVFAASLPVRCQAYDLYRGYKVVINDSRPYLHHDVYHRKYSQYRECNDRQPVLRDCSDREDEDDEDDKRFGHGHGQGHAHGHHKHHDEGDDH